MAYLGQLPHTCRSLGKNLEPISHVAAMIGVPNKNLIFSTPGYLKIKVCLSLDSIRLDMIEGKIQIKQMLRHSLVFFLCILTYPFQLSQSNSNNINNIKLFFSFYWLLIFKVGNKGFFLGLPNHPTACESNFLQLSVQETKDASPLAPVEWAVQVTFFQASIIQHTYCLGQIRKRLVKCVWHPWYSRLRLNFKGKSAITIYFSMAGAPSNLR